MDLQTTAGIIDFAIKLITILLLVIASSQAIKKKNNICLSVAILGNLVIFYFTQSPILCWIVSIACLIWAVSTKTSEADKNNSDKQTLKSSKAIVEYRENNKKMVKTGPIIGLIIGILMAGFPIVGFMMGEASLSDPQGKMMGIGFIIFGAFMVIVNLIVLATGKENLLASDNPQTTTTTTISTSNVTSKEKSQETTDKIRCRFCKKLYSSEYNGCPYCKKK